MTNLNYLDLITFLRNKVTDPALVKKTVSIAVGFSIARLMPLPTSCVEFTNDYYSTSVRPLASHIVGQFNENVLLDVDLTEQVVRSHWLIRYAHAYPTDFIALTECTKAHFMTKLSGVSHLVNSEIQDFCDSSPELMIVIVNRVTDVLRKTQAI